MRGKFEMEKSNVPQEKRKQTSLLDLPNIGVALESQLHEVGIFTYEDLEKKGAKQVWLMIQQIDVSACIHRLLALEGAIEGVKKTQLPEDVKKDLKEFYHWNRK